MTRRTAGGERQQQGQRDDGCESLQHACGPPWIADAKTARNRLKYDGIRRCQRLPELTHPVDSARLRTSTSKAVPAEITYFSEDRCSSASVAVDALTCGKDNGASRRHNLSKNGCV